MVYDLYRSYRNPVHPYRGIFRGSKDDKFKHCLENIEGAENVNCKNKDF